MMKMIISIFMLSLAIMPLFQGSCRIQGCITQPVFFNNEPNPVANNWTPPHLLPTKEVYPSTIYVENDKGYPDVANVTFTVMGVGQPLWHYVRINMTIVFDLSKSMEKDYNGSSMLNMSKEASSGIVGKFLSQPRHSRYYSVSILSFYQNETTNKTEFITNLPFTNNQTMLNNTIKSLTTTGNCTPLHDGIIDSYNYSGIAFNPSGDNSIPGESTSNCSIILVFTCGNNTCGLNNLDDTIATINSSKPDNLISIGIASWGPQCNNSACFEICNASNGLFLHNQSVREIENQFTPIYIGTVPNPEILAGTCPSPTQYMIVDVLPPYIHLINSSINVTPNNNVTIRYIYCLRFSNGVTELLIDVKRMELYEVFQITYQIKSNLTGWQSIGVTKDNSSIYGSNYSRVKYQDYQYVKTLDPADIWTNETPDVSIYVMPIPVPELTIPIITALSIVFIAVVAIRRRWH